jgi:hypothetical protein
LTPTIVKQPSDIYKTATIFLAGALLSMITAYVAISRNAVTKDELPALIQQNNPYTQDAKDIKTRLDDLKERIILLDAYQKQIGQDVADIASSTGVTARPITNNKGKHP